MQARALTATPFTPCVIKSIAGRARSYTNKNTD